MGGFVTSDSWSFHSIMNVPLSSVFEKKVINSVCVSFEQKVGCQLLRSKFILISVYGNGDAVIFAPDHVLISHRTALASGLGVRVGSGPQQSLRSSGSGPGPGAGSESGHVRFLGPSYHGGQTTAPEKPENWSSCPSWSQILVCVLPA